MRKAKAITKHFRGLGSSKEGSEVPVSVEGSNRSPKLTGTCSTAPQSVTASSSSHGTAAKQTGTGTVGNSDERAGHIAATVVQPESHSSSLNPSYPPSADILSTSTSQTPATSTPQKSRERTVMPSRISRSLTELDIAMTEFRQNYELFAKKHPDVFLLDDEFNTAFRSAEATDDIKRSAQIFGDGIWAVLQTIETKKNIGKSAWLTKLGNFLTKVYPVAMLSLNLTTTVAEVSLDHLNSDVVGDILLTVERYCRGTLYYLTGK